MRVAAKRGLWSASASPARFVAGRRFPLPPSRTTRLRSFHISVSSQRRVPWSWSWAKSASKTSPRGNGSSTADIRGANSRHSGDTARPAQRDRSLEFETTPEERNAQSNGDSIRPGQLSANDSSSVGYLESYTDNAQGAGDDPDGGASDSITDHVRHEVRSAQRPLKRNRKSKERTPAKLSDSFLERNVKLATFDSHNFVQGKFNIFKQSVSVPSFGLTDDALSRTFATQFDELKQESRKAMIQAHGAEAFEASRVISADPGGHFRGEMMKCFNNVIELLAGPSQLLDGQDEGNRDDWEAKILKEVAEFSRSVMRLRAWGSVDEGLVLLLQEHPRFREEIEAFRESETHFVKQKEQAPIFDALGYFNSQREDPKQPQSSFWMDSAQFTEANSLVNASLTLPSRAAPTMEGNVPDMRAHIRFVCPVVGGQYFVDKMVESVATDYRADLIVLNAQDIAEVGSDHIKQHSSAASDAVLSLGFDAAQAHGHEEAAQDDHEDNSVAAEDEEEDVEFDARGRSRFGGTAAVPLMSVSLDSKDIQHSLKRALGGAGFLSLVPDSKHRHGNDSSRMQMQAGHMLAQQELEANLTAMAESILDAPAQKKARDVLASKNFVARVMDKVCSYNAQPLTSLQARLMEDTDSLQRLPTIVLISGYNEIRQTPAGVQVLDKLMESIQKQRNDGHPIVLVGSSVDEELYRRDRTKDPNDLITVEDHDSETRSVLVTPIFSRGEPFKRDWSKDETRKKVEVNMRNLYSMAKLMRGLEGRSPSDPWLPFKQNYEAFATAFLKKPDEIPKMLTERYLTMQTIHRIVSIAIGLGTERRYPWIGTEAIALSRPELKEFEGETIARAMHTIERSQASRVMWAETHLTLAAQQRRQKKAMQKMMGQIKSQRSITDIRVHSLRKQCNRHERPLLKGVVNPEDIRTTFKDVHAPRETKDALQTLTTLSLTRPDAFQYGVLATEKISGVLLYGPPGTGKTLLARAVAKQSGATVLEVSGSDLYNMYVGEGEKNVRAVFSLAKKLAPCVVFIDEADAIFGARGSSASRTTHRELINQFLREWDGMKETTAFIMVATNRPFDLDEAALRRLPRRLLIDLPTEEDRTAILRIHLKDETLDSSVFIEKLAAQTPYYSGSDLKNLAVAAALAAVREEEATRLKAFSADKTHTAPARRVLQLRHFDRALEEISASINEDMNSLKAIKTFDEKYGDKKGARSKRKGYGFGLGGEQKRDTVKVRA